MISQLYNNQEDFQAKASRPSDYPTPSGDNLLFFIQTNANLNTVAYELNLKSTGSIDPQQPMHTYWIRYSTDGQVEELNYMQNKLAYGYDFSYINDNTIEFVLVSYPSRKLYITKNKQDKYVVVTKIDNEMSVLESIYVVIDELGVFPNVKYVELWGSEMEKGFGSYEKIIIQ
ncbi:MAG TPA: DUF4833 domain-containing protein [Saprospiraceae bacterium]|nr:DUF4833 domain-containing protein [Saprospiraceae bacterium]MCB9328258.1 DUF4833 domain-containing protein [Lewinellaceae bacterium]HPK09634.1 DUF4833 domain-containing protein [Saprospiraceae bacterium]HPQ22032.1 DUF4833 domain-containing protein [Saprospiraceae bacterium]HRX29459.1 DUF4833 domain-containing protein [Saprospiraceae bacterium]